MKHTWTPIWKPNSGENHRCCCPCLQYLLYGTLFTTLFWCRIISIHKTLPAEGYNLLLFSSYYWKGAPTPCSHLPATPGRDLLPLDLIYQPLLEGSYYPLISFTSYHWKGATTPLLKASTLSTTPDHVSSIFTLDPNSFNTTQLVSLFSSYF